MLLLLLSLLSVSAALPVGELVDCGFPNGTDKALHWFVCATGEQLTVNNITVTDGNGKYEYPIDPTKNFIVDLIAYNNGAQINDNLVNVTLSQYMAPFQGGSCVWNKVPTFGLLNGIDGCKFANNCPLTSGQLFLQLPVDVSQFSTIINSLASYKPYQLEIRMFDNTAGRPHKEIACIVAQMELS